MTQLDEKALEASRNAIARHCYDGAQANEIALEAIRAYLSALPSSPVSELVEKWRTAMEGVTPGPWTLIPAREYDGDYDDLIGSYTSPASIEGGDGNPVCTFGSEDGSGTLFENEANHRYVQRCSPNRIDALVTSLSTRNAELEREVKRLRGAVEAVQAISREYVTEYAGRSYTHCTSCEVCLSEEKPHSDNCAWTLIDAALSTSPQGGEHE